MKSTYLGAAENQFAKPVKYLLYCILNSNEHLSYIAFFLLFLLSEAFLFSGSIYYQCLFEIKLDKWSN
jgi:hypothetical protein